MFEQLTIFETARAMVLHAGRRQTIIAENVANADTPGYRARDIVPFAEAYRSGHDATAMKATRPDHLNGTLKDVVSARIFVRPGETEPNGNTVSIEQELVRGAETREQFDRALAIYKSSLDILRASLGRA